MRGDLRRGLGLRLHAPVTTDAGEQVKRLVGVKNIYLDVGGTSESGEPPPAGDYHPRGPAAWKQRPYLTLTHRVVEHDQDLPVGEQVAIHLRPLVEAFWYIRTRYAERPEKALEHLHRADRIRGPSVEVGEQLPVREIVGHAMGCVYRKAGLAYSPLTHDHHHGHRKPFVLSGRGDQVLIDLVKLLRPAGEIRDVGGQQARNLLFLRLNLDGLGGRVKGRVGSEDGVLKMLQPFTGFNSQLVDHGAPGLPVNLQRLGGAVTAVQGEHQLAAQLFPERELFHEIGELADQVVMPAQLKFEVSAVFVGSDALLVQPVSRHPDQLAVYTVKRGTPPEPERIAIAGHGLVKVIRVARLTSGGHQLIELLGVKPSAVDLNDVAMR